MSHSSLFLSNQWQLADDEFHEFIESGFVQDAKRFRADPKGLPHNASSQPNEFAGDL